MKHFYFSKQLFFLLFFCFLIGEISFAQSTIAIDTARNAVYNTGWRDSLNGGSGFRPWRLTSGGSAGFFIGNPANNGMSTAGIDSVAFGMFATGTQYANARRTFAAPMKVGDELSFYWAMNWDANTGNKGFDLLANDSIKVFNINNRANSSSILLDTSATRKDTVLRNYGTRPMLVKLNRKDASSYTLTITSRDSTESSYVGTIRSSLAINALNLYIGDQRDQSGNRNIYFNKFRITSLDSTITRTNEVFTNDWVAYPNPVNRGSRLNLAFNSRVAGKYTVTLYNLSGMRLLQKVMIHAGNNAQQQMDIPSDWAPGIYFTEITGGGKREVLKLLVK